MQLLAFNSRHEVLIHTWDNITQFFYGELWPRCRSIVVYLPISQWYQFAVFGKICFTPRKSLVLQAYVDAPIVSGYTLRSKIIIANSYTFRTPG